MFRKLSALEIAEGALLADVAIVFQLLTLYLPIGGEFFRVLIFVVFAVLVLRRGLYVGVMGMIVAIFLSTIVVGPQLIIAMLLEAMGGIFLGYTMKLRMSHFLLLFIGITFGALASYSVVFLTTFLLGLPLNTLVLGLHNGYNGLMTALGAVFASFGLGIWWTRTFLPFTKPFITFGFTYWALLYYVALWVLLCPFVTVIYFVTNNMVRRLGYKVRPFPDGRLHKWRRRFARSLLKRTIRNRRELRKRRAASA